MDILDVWFESGASSHAVLDFDPDTSRSPAPTPRRPLRRGRRPAPRLVHVLAALLHRHAQPRALQRGRHLRLDPRRKGPRPLQIPRQLHRPRRHHGPARRRHRPPLGRLRRLPRRRSRQPAPAQAPRRRDLPQAPQHLPLPPRQPQRNQPHHRRSPRLRPAPTRHAVPSIRCSRSTSTSSPAPPSSPARSPRPTPTSSSTASTTCSTSSSTPS